MEIKIFNRNLIPETKTVVVGYSLQTVEVKTGRLTRQKFCQIIDKNSRLRALDSPKIRLRWIGSVKFENLTATDHDQHHLESLYGL